MSEQVFNVKDFGAVGDGKTDDSAAIKTAIQAAHEAGGTVYFPEGRYHKEVLTSPQQTPDDQGDK